MNVFILCTGRCGSVTFAKACERGITNYTTGHETMAGRIGPLEYPNWHIEVDNRLTWRTGELAEHARRLKFAGRHVLYAWLRRNSEDTAQSFLRRWPAGIIGAWAHQVMQRRSYADQERIVACRQFVKEANANIGLYLDVVHTVAGLDAVEIEIDDPEPGFRAFWRMVGAEGDLYAALREFAVRHNASPEGAVSEVKE